MRKRIIQGLAAIFSGQLIATLGNLLLVPLYLTIWSPSVYGEWLALFSLVSYLGVLDLGVNMAVINRLTQDYARGDLRNYARCQHSALAFYLLLALTGSLLLTWAAWNLPLPRWVGLRETPPATARWVVWLLGLQVVWGLPLGLVIGAYRTTGNLARSQWLSNIRQLATIGLVALVLLLSGGMKAVAAYQLAPFFLLTFYVLWDLRKKFAELSPGLSEASLSGARELLRPSLLFGLITFATAISLQGPVLIISTVLGGAAVALFVTSRTLTALIRQIIGAFNLSLWPDLTMMEARQERGRLRSLHRLLTAGSTTLCVGVAATLWYEGGEVISIWTRGKLTPDETLLRLLLVLLVLQSAWMASGIFAAASNRHTTLSWAFMISATLGVGMAALLVRRLGTWAVPVGLIAGEAIACYHFVIHDVCRLLEEPYLRFACRLWLGLAATGAVSLLAGWAAHTAIPGPFVIRWVGVGFTTLTVSMAVAWAVWLTPEDRTLLSAKLRLLRALMSYKGV